MTEFGAGANKAGLTRAGLDPAGDTTDPIARPVLAAERFDLSTKDFEVDSDGLVVEEHPIDQMMVMGVGTERGSIPSAPDVGRTLKDLVRLPSTHPRFKTLVESRIMAANPVAALVTARDVEVLSIAINVPKSVPGRTEIIVEYRNLRTSKVATTSTVI